MELEPLLLDLGTYHEYGKFTLMTGSKRTASVDELEEEHLEQGVVPVKLADRAKIKRVRTNSLLHVPCRLLNLHV